MTIFIPVLLAGASLWPGAVVAEESRGAPAADRRGYECRVLRNPLDDTTSPDDIVATYYTGNRDLSAVERACSRQQRATPGATTYRVVWLARLPARWQDDELMVPDTATGQDTGTTGDEEPPASAWGYECRVLRNPLDDTTSPDDIVDTYYSDERDLAAVERGCSRQQRATAGATTYRVVWIASLPSGWQEAELSVD
jgi:hypothetical protein